MLIIVDYDAGNVRSVQRACQHVGMPAEISADPERVLAADRLIFPGVGSAISAMDTLRAGGLDAAIISFYQSGKPLLGICLGLQIALEFTGEGDQDCLGILPGACERFEFSDPALKVPHIGWNELTLAGQHPMLAKVADGEEFYFVHSYYAKPIHQEHILGTTDYGDKTFCSVLGNNNFLATQFHLEKSGEAGLRLLAAFATWDGQPAC